MIKNDKSTAEETGVEVEGVDFMAKRVLSLLVDNTSGVLEPYFRTFQPQRI